MSQAVFFILGLASGAGLMFWARRQERREVEAEKERGVRQYLSERQEARIVTHQLLNSEREYARAYARAAYQDGYNRGRHEAASIIVK